MNSELVYDATMVSQILSGIESSIKNSRITIDDIMDKYEKVSSYKELEDTKDLMRLYGDCADDYSKLCFIQSSVTESMLDLRTIRKIVATGESSMPVSLQKSYRMRIDSSVEQLNLFKESVQTSRQGLEARVRYYSSCSYMFYDKVVGSKC